MIFKKSTLYKLLIILLISLEGVGQPLLRFNINQVSGMKGDIVCVDIHVENFTDISSMQFNISYNATLVSPITPIDFSTSDLAPDIDNSNFNLNTKDNGYIKFVWEHTPSITLPDGALLFTLCFQIIGDPGNISPVYVNNLLLDIEICRENEMDERICVDKVDSEIGTITITSNNLQVFVNRCDADVNNTANGGSATFYAAGGTPPYTYTINPGGYTGTLNSNGERGHEENLPMGNYTIEITDAAGLKVSKNFVVSSNLPIVVTEDVKDPSCFSRRNGRIEVNANGGLGPYKYEWSNYVSNTGINNGLYAGNYSVTITDFNGCEVIRSFQLKADTLKFDVAILDSTACQEVRTGVITISNVSGGTSFSDGSYQYLVNNVGSPIKFMSPFDVTKLPGGVLKVVVQDSFACRVEKEIVMPSAMPFGFNLEEFNNVSCHGLNDGYIKIRPNSGFGFSYMPDDKMDETQTGNLGGSFVASNLEPGIYTITARNNYGCVQPYEFEIKDPGPIELNDLVIQPDCNDKGSITLNPTGGTGAYTYNWSTGNGNVNQIIDIVTGGTFVVTVTDENNCSATKSFSINDYGALAISVESNDVSCQGRTDGSAFVEVVSNTGTIPMFTVFWKDANGVTIATGPTTINNLPPGNYFVEVVDEFGCSSTPRPFTIHDAPELTIVTNIDPIKCYDQEGTITASVNGVVAGYTFEWRDKVSGQILDNDNVITTKAGTYVLKITTASGCSVENDIVLTQPDKIVFDTPELRKVTCFGDDNGQAAILTSYPQITFEWSSGSVGPFAINLPAGPGWVVGKSLGCVSDTIHFIIDTNPILELDNSKTQLTEPSCFGDSNGSIAVDAIGGTGIGYKYAWDNGAQSSIINNLPAGDYVVTISDNNNCEQVISFTLSQPDLLEVFLDNARSVELDCNNTDNGSIALTTRGGNPGVKQIKWETGINTEGNVAVNLSPGTYCATVTDNQGCSATYCHTLTAPIPLEGKLRTPAEPLCFGGSTCLSVDYISGGTGNAYTFQINNGIRYPIDSCVTVYAGQYFISLIDSAGCSIDTVIMINQPNPIQVELGEDKDIQLGLPSPQIIPFIDSPVGISSAVWSPNEYIECLNIDCTEVEMTPPITTTYFLTVTDNNGCTGSDEITIRVREVRNVYFANVFSPNSDGYNDYFQAVTGIGVEKIVAFSVYDRWGNRVFFKENYVPDPAGTDGWDGTFSGRKMNPGVYVYYARALFIDGKEIDYSGSVTLIDSDRN